MVLRRKNLRT